MLLSLLSATARSHVKAMAISVGRATRDFDLDLFCRSHFTFSIMELREEISITSMRVDYIYVAIYILYLVVFLCC